MRLPNAERAVVDIRKLTDYCLSPSHPRGRHKAKVFAATCGITAEHAVSIQSALLDGAKHLEADLGEQDRYGQRYLVDLEVVGPSGTAQIRSAWIVRKHEDFPRLVSCFVL